MHYVREYTPTCRFLKIINSTLMDLLIIFKNQNNLSNGEYTPTCILHYLNYSGSSTNRTERHNTSDILFKQILLKTHNSNPIINVHHSYSLSILVYIDLKT